MSQFSSFKEKFDNTYRTINDFIWDVEESNELEAELKENEDEVDHDSYGNEETTLSRVYYFHDWDVHVRFTGSRSSYDGEDWIRMTEVKPTIKTIHTYE